MTGPPVVSSIFEFALVHSNIARSMENALVARVQPLVLTQRGFCFQPAAFPHTNTCIMPTTYVYTLLAKSIAVGNPSRQTFLLDH